MHVGVFTYYYLPIVNGVILTIADWKRELGKHGIATTIFVPQLDLFAPIQDPDIVEYPAVPLYKKFGVTVPLFAQQLLPQELVKRNIDIVHIHHPSFIGRQAVAIARKLHLPVVFTYHSRYETYAKLYLPFVPTWVVDWVVKREVITFMNSCDCVTVALPSFEKELRLMGVNVPVRVVPIGIDVARFAKGDGSHIRTRMHVGKNDIVLLYVGRLAHEKNIDFLIDMFALLSRHRKNVHLCFVGKGPREKAVWKRIVRFGLERRVHIIAPEAYDRMPDYYACADIFVYASQTETFGRVYVEAMAAGLPVVALAMPALADVIEDGVSGVLVHTKTPAAFARAVEKLIENNHMRRRLGNAARVRAKKVFSLSSSGATLSGLYRSLVKNK